MLQAMGQPPRFEMKTFQTLFILILVYYVAEMSTLLPSEREDVMGKYWFMNRYQCERLCWYRKLCKTYSYIYNRTPATDGNCVLHAVNIPSNTTSAVSTDWVEREAFWDEASVPFNEPLPGVVTTGWEACFKGNFTPDSPALTRMNFNFHDRQKASCDYNPASEGNIYLALDFRHEFKVQQQVLWFWALNNCTWSDKHTLGNLPLGHNDFFEITLRILDNSTMEIIYRNLTTQQLDLVSNNISLTGATYLEIIRDVKLFYVDLGRGCE